MQCLDEKPVTQVKCFQRPHSELKTALRVQEVIYVEREAVHHMLGILDISKEEPCLPHVRGQVKPRRQLRFSCLTRA
jgi:hypothetical protein